MCVTCDPDTFESTVSFDSKTTFLCKRMSEKLLLICTDDIRNREYFFAADNDKGFRFKTYYCPTCGRHFY